MTDRWDRLAAMAESGTADSFLACSDDVKRDFFAMAVDDSARRKTAETILASVQEEYALCRRLLLERTANWQDLARSVGRLARSDGQRTFDVCARDLMLIDDLCRAALRAPE